MSRRPNDPTAGVVGRIFPDLLGIQDTKGNQLQVRRRRVFELKAKEDGQQRPALPAEEGLLSGLLRLRTSSTARLTAQALHHHDGEHPLADF